MDNKNNIIIIILGLMIVIFGIYVIYNSSELSIKMIVKQTYYNENQFDILLIENINNIRLIGLMIILIALLIFYKFIKI